MSTPSIVTFGEIMLRLSTPGFSRFLQADRFDVNYGGGEANVAASLAQFGLDASYVSRFPKNEFGEAALKTLRGYGVNTEYVLRGGDRLGIYFLESGASQRPSKVIYDRAGAAIAEIKPGMVDWAKVFAGKTWFHITGITPALSASAAEASIEAVQAAKKAGLTVSCDLNYRKKLWTTEEAGATMSKLMAYVDVAIANEEDCHMVFGIHAEGSDVEAGVIDAHKYQEVASKMIQRFPNLKKVAITLRESISASDNNWSAVLYDGKNFMQSRRYAIRIVDRVGGGDSFGAGLIFGMATGRSESDALEFAVAASCIKHTIPGDINVCTVSEVDALIKEGGSGRVQR